MLTFLVVVILDAFKEAGADGDELPALFLLSQFLDHGLVDQLLSVPWMQCFEYGPEEASWRQVLGEVVWKVILQTRVLLHSLPIHVLHEQVVVGRHRLQVCSIKLDVLAEGGLRFCQG